jgi:cell division initiation protein
MYNDARSAKECASMFLTPPEIQHQTLKSGRGYDREDVDRLLEHVTSSYEQVWLERDELRSRLTQLEDKLASFREKERLLSDALVTAQRAAEELRSEARREAEQLKEEALAQVGSAKAEAERDLEQLRVAIERFRSLERELRSNLRAFLEEALRQIGDGRDLEGAPDETLTDALRPETANVKRDDG